MMTNDVCPLVLLVYHGIGACGLALTEQIFLFILNRKVL